MGNAETQDNNKLLPSEFELAQIRDALRGLRFGTVSIVVQDGVVVQIDRTEKRRLTRVRKESGL